MSVFLFLCVFFFLLVCVKDIRFCRCKCLCVCPSNLLYSSVCFFHMIVRMFSNRIGCIGGVVFVCVRVYVVVRLGGVFAC